MNNLAHLPPAEQVKTLRKARLFMVLGLVVLEGFTGYDLWSVDTGRVLSADTWLPLGMLYDFAGFWPAVLALPVVGVILWVVATRRIKKAEQVWSASR